MGLNIGGFTQGLQSGLGTGMALRRGRQDERVRDILTRQMEDEEGARQADMASLGMEYSETGLEDPFFFRLTDWFRGRSGGRRKALPSQAQPQPGVPVMESGMEGDPTQGLYADGGMPKRSALRGYAEGGKVTPEEEMKRRAAANRARNPASVSSRTESVTNDTTLKKEAPSRSSAPRGGALRTLGRVAGGAAVLAGGAGGVKGALNPENVDERWQGMSQEEYDREKAAYDAKMRIPFTDKSFGDPELFTDMGERGRSAVRGVFRGLFGSGGGDKQPVAAPAAPAPAPAPVTAPTGAGSASAISRARSAPVPAAQPSGPMGPPQQQQIDLSNVSPQEVPDFKVDDWSKHREQAVRSLVARGIPLADAFERVDQQVTAMQQRGFTNFAQQGLMLMQAGNQRGAMAAFRAAFQYFPSGTDVKFGMQNGQIIGIGVDEKTGETVGAPMLLDAERVAAMIDNFKTPGAWQVWAKDRRDFQQKMREYEEVTKPQSEALSSAALTQADAAQQRAANEAESVRMGGGPGASGMLTHQRDAMRQLSDAYMNIEGVDGDPMLARALASVSMQIWQRYGGEKPWPMIVEAVSRAAQIQDPQQRAAFFARLGVVDPMSAGVGPPQ